MTKLRPKAKMVAAAAAGPTVNCSPLRRRNFLGGHHLRIRSAPKSDPSSVTGPLASGHKKSDTPLPVLTGVKKIVSQYAEMETELQTMKRRCVESRQKVRALKDLLREQRTKSRQLIVSCALKLQEKEREAEALQRLRKQELAAISRELVFLKSNMLKEQKRVERALADKDRQLEDKQRELDGMRVAAALAEGVRREAERPETPDSSSPDASPDRYAVPRFHIRPLGDQRRVRGSLSPGKAPPALPPPYQTGIRRPTRLRFPPSRGQSADEAFICTPMVQNLEGIEDKESAPKEDSGKDSDSEHYEVIDVLGSTALAASNPTYETLDLPPTPPALPKGGFHLPPSPSDEGGDSSPPPSGRHNASRAGSVSSHGSSCTTATTATDEGFGGSCCEEIQKFSDFLREEGLNQRSVISPSVALTNHKSFQKPSAVKQRRVMKSVMSSDLTVLEEHQVSGDGNVTTVTYWSQQYL